MKKWQKYTEQKKKKKLQFKKETIDVISTDPKGIETTEAIEVLLYLWTSNIQLHDCDIEIDEQDIKKKDLKELQNWSFMDKDFKIFK